MNVTLHHLLKFARKNGAVELIIRKHAVPSVWVEGKEQKIYLPPVSEAGFAVLREEALSSPLSSNAYAIPDFGTVFLEESNNTMRFRWEVIAFTKTRKNLLQRLFS